MLCSSVASISRVPSSNQISSLLLHINDSLMLSEFCSFQDSEWTRCFVVPFRFAGSEEDSIGKRAVVGSRVRFYFRSENFLRGPKNENRWRSALLQVARVRTRLAFAREEKFWLKTVTIEAQFYVDQWVFLTFCTLCSIHFQQPVSKKFSFRVLSSCHFYLSPLLFTRFFASSFVR